MASPPLPRAPRKVLRRPWRGAAAPVSTRVRAAALARHLAGRAIYTLLPAQPDQPSQSQPEGMPGPANPDPPVPAPLISPSLALPSGCAPAAAAPGADRARSPPSPGRTLGRDLSGEPPPALLGPQKHLPRSTAARPQLRRLPQRSLRRTEGQGRAEGPGRD